MDISAALPTEMPSLNGLAALVRDPFRRGSITVLDGAHAGLETTFSGESLRVGAALDNDIVLLGDGLEPHHFELTIADPLARRVIVEAVDQALVIDDLFLDIGQKKEVELPAELSFGEARIRLTPMVDYRRLLNVAFGVIGAFCIGYAIVGLFILNSGARAGRIPSFAPKPAISGASMAPTSSMALALRAKIEQAGLGQQITLEQLSADSVLASGQIDPALVPVWRDVIKWFDAQGSGTIQNSVVAASPGADLPKVGSVWYGNTPEVMFANGRNAAHGESAPNGWKVEQIDPGGVSFSRDGARTRRIELQKRAGS